VDEKTIQAARRGDREALAALMRALQDSWYRMSLGLLSDPDLAQDATQETAIRFMRQLSGFRGESQLRTWSLGICLNVAREIRRWSRGQKSLEDGPETAGLRDDDEMPDVAAERGEEIESLRALLVRLPDRQREAVVLRFFEEMSVEQTAEAMQCAPGTVKATVHQALRSLRRKMERVVS
jgi:RNA polymerase sigma-70 factor (ECF subfamily)